MTDKHRPVLVVGAGPVGLTAALALRARGQPATVLEAQPIRQREGSRATFTHRSSLALLEGMQAGLGRRIADHGLVWSTKRSFWRGEEIFARTYPPVPAGVLPPFTSLPQSDIERHLLDACRRADVELIPDTRVATVRSGAGAVWLTTERGDEWTCDYLIGADGARSQVRAAIGVPLRGRRSATWFIIVDVADGPGTLPVERHFHYQHPALDHRNVLLVPFTGGWRVDLQCRRGDDAEAFSSPDGLRDWLTRVIPAAYADAVTWVSTYRFLQVVAQTFVDQHHRVLLVGEAAHLFAPFGARGMNSGIGDADAAAAAVSAALETADRAAVQRFASERRAVALDNRRAAGRALAHMQGTNPLRAARRRLAVAMAPRSTRAAAWLDDAPYGAR